MGERIMFIVDSYLCFIPGVVSSEFFFYTVQSNTNIKNFQTDLFEP